MAEKKVKTLKGNRRVIRKKFDEWEKNAREEGKPICIACAHLDNDNGKLAAGPRRVTEKPPAAKSTVPLSLA